MPALLKISDAASIAIHTLDYMIQENKPIYIASNLSKELCVSYNHLSKILQLLAKHGYLKTTRGPSGGYSLTEKGRQATIKEIVNLVDGEIEKNTCLMENKICKRENCVLQKFMSKVIEDFEKIIEVKIKDF